MSGAFSGLSAANDDEFSNLWRIFAGLTIKQRQVLALIAENRTSKEMAWYLGVSESAVNQRIEAVRARLGSAPRGELARIYRRYLAASPS